MEVFDARILSGQSFHLGDVGEDATAVVVDDAFVHHARRGGEALGRRIRHVSARERAGADAESALVQIVGVCEDLLTNPVSSEAVMPEVYYPVAPAQTRQALFNVRLGGIATAKFSSRLRGIVTNVDPTLRLGPVRTLTDRNGQEPLIARLVGWIVV